MTLRDELNRPAADHGAILKALLERDVSFLLIGGLAVRAHGYPRTTLDVDILPDPSASNLRRLAAALQALEASAVDDRGRRLPLDLSHPESLALGNYFLLTSVGGLDIVNGPVPDLKRYRRPEGRAEGIRLDALVLPVIGLDDLLRMKREAGRDKDLRDIAALTEVERASREGTGERRGG